MEQYRTNDLNKVIRGPKRADYDKEVVFNILDDHMICHVSYKHNGVALSIPTGYGRKGETLYLHGSIKNRMMLSILEEEQASITVTHLDGLVLARSVFHHSVNYRSAVVFGKPRLVSEKNEKMEALRLITENFIKGRWDEARLPNEKEFNATLVVAVEIEHASAKIRAEGVNDEKADLELDIWAGVVPCKMIYEEPVPEPDLKEGVVTPNSVSGLSL